jgi:hypothetical protein
MQLVDRIILGAIAVGIWVWLAASLFSPAIARSLDSSDIDDFQSQVEQIVEDCSVDGTVDDGTINASISC